MPMILAMNGADDFGYFGEFGAAAPAIVELQTALVALGKGIGDNILSKIVVDGVIGPKTVAATNRALTVHLGAGQAPANLRTGSLSQALVVSQATTLATLITAEVARRGFAPPVAKKVTVAAAKPKAAHKAATYTPPTEVQYPMVVASGTDMGSIVKWSAIGVGAVTVLGIAYYLITKKDGAPAMAGFFGENGVWQPIGSGGRRRRRH